MRSKSLLDKSKIIRSFSRSAETYDRYSDFQKKLAVQLVDMVNDLKIEPGTMLDIGTGTGEAAFLLKDIFPSADIIGCDIAPGMIEKAIQKGSGIGGKGSGIRFDVADCEKLPYKEKSFDLVVSNSTFQWVEDLEAVFGEVGRVLKPEGFFVFITLGPMTLRELRAAYVYSYGPGEGYLHKYRSVADIRRNLADLGFEILKCESKIYKETYHDVKQLFRTIKGIGALNASTELPKGLRSNEKMRKLIKTYEGNFRSRDNIYATYEADCFACFLPAEIL